MKRTLNPDKSDPTENTKGKFILNQALEGPSPAKFESKARKEDSPDKPKSLFG